MSTGVIIIGVLILAAIAFAIFRVSVLLGVVRKDHKKRVTGANKVNAYFMVAFMVIGLVAFFWFSYVYFDDYNIPLASNYAPRLYSLFYITIAVTGFVFVVTQILLFWFSYKYQYDPTRAASFYPKNDKLEIIWTIVPSIVLAALIFGGWQLWSEITGEGDENAEVIEIMGYQFAWLARYPGMDQQLGKYDYRATSAQNDLGLVFSDEAAMDDFSSRTLVLPVGKPVELKIRARDVLHSVWLPHFQMKMDAVPGMPTRMQFIATKTTEQMREELGDPDFKYNLACTEICGRGHFSMSMNVEVLEQDEYDAWFEEQKSVLESNPDLMATVPADMRELAALKAGFGETE